MHSNSAVKELLRATELMIGRTYAYEVVHREQQGLGVHVWGQQAPFT